ncbi:MAG: GNAT family N-acetyltransferase [Desulfuromonas sp.]|nr:MAG: GNAT family N-acetyltransferase [Desulfuromonas sp.]
MHKNIRKYSDSDLENLLDAWENASKLAHPFLTNDLLVTTRKNIPIALLPKADTWVYVHEGIVVGFISLIGNEIAALFVQPKFHGIGAGRALVDKARELHDELEVEVFEINSIGLQFYLKCGFVAFLEKNHEITNKKVLRMKITANKLINRTENTSVQN